MLSMLFFCVPNFSCIFLFMLIDTFYWKTLNVFSFFFISFNETLYGKVSQLTRRCQRASTGVWEATCGWLQRRKESRKEREQINLKTNRYLTLSRPSSNQVVSLRTENVYMHNNVEIIATCRPLNVGLRLPTFFSHHLFPGYSFNEMKRTYSIFFNSTFFYFLFRGVTHKIN